MTAPGYLDTILDICRRENIDAVLPLQEDELYLIAAHRSLRSECLQSCPWVFMPFLYFRVNPVFKTLC